MAQTLRALANLQFAISDPISSLAFPGLLPRCRYVSQSSIAHNWSRSVCCSIFVGRGIEHLQCGLHLFIDQRLSLASACLPSIHPSYSLIDFSICISLVCRQENAVLFHMFVITQHPTCLLGRAWLYQSSSPYPNQGIMESVLDCPFETLVGKIQNTQF